MALDLRARRLAWARRAIGAFRSGQHHTSDRHDDALLDAFGP